jgi:O-antigen ligase
MKKSKVANRTADISPASWLIGGLAVTTLYFQTNLTDPFNSPKMWILILLASWLLGYIFSFKTLILNIKPLRNLFVLLSFFVIISLFVTIATDYKYVAIFGDTQRRNGLLSYFSLSVVMLASAIFIRFFNVKRVYFITFAIGLVSLIYGVMQTSGRDFIKWNNPYNSIIGTVGNPNFAAAVMAIMGVIIFSTIFVKDFNLYLRIFGLLISVSLLILIYLSDARQGLLAYLLGASVFIIILLFDKNKKLGIAASISGIFVFISALLGMLQIGPLEKFLYKPSVSVRGYYWRAGLEMLRDKPFTGVGMDRYGAYFKDFREVGYPLSYGFDITSSNAHNTFIQLFATGGLFLGITYLLINGYILKRAIAGLKALTGTKKLLLAGIFSAWIAFHAQSLVSIDNLGISIWGWLLGGSIVGLSISAELSESEDRAKFVMKPGQINLGRVMVSSAVTIISVILVSILYRGENLSFQSRTNFNLNDSATKVVFRNLQVKVIDSKLIDPTYALYSGMYLVRGGYVDEGVAAVKNILKNDPRNLDALNALALIYEQLGKYDDAISYRLNMAELDQWNATNYLALGKAYKAKGDLVNSQKMLDKILSFASADPISNQAKIDLA